MTEKIVPKLEECLKMKQLGFPQKGAIFYWVRGNDESFEWDIYYRDEVESSLFNTIHCVAAPTLEEIDLPFYLHTKDTTEDRCMSELEMGVGAFPMRSATYRDVWVNKTKILLHQVGETQTSANARMWIKLAENDLFKDNPHYE